MKRHHSKTGSPDVDDLRHLCCLLTCIQPSPHSFSLNTWIKTATIQLPLDTSFVHQPFQPLSHLVQPPGISQQNHQQLLQSIILQRCRRYRVLFARYQVGQTREMMQCTCGCCTVQVFHTLYFVRFWLAGRKDVWPVNIHGNNETGINSVD